MSTTDQQEDINEEVHDEAHKVMSLMEHLGELRSRLVKCVLVMLFFFCLTIPFAKQIINYLKQPLLNAVSDANLNLHFTGPFDAFIATIKVSILVSVVVSCPVWIFQIWRFVEPALYEKEKKWVVPFSMISILLFLFGVCFSYFLVVPMALQFLLGLGVEIAAPIITIKDYLSMLMLMIFGFGMVFETPVILVLMGLLGVVNASLLAKYRGIILVCIFVVGALLTPPDPISQLAMAVPLYLMFEASIIILRMLGKNS